MFFQKNNHSTLTVRALCALLLLELCSALPLLAGAPNPAAKVLIIYNDDNCDSVVGYETAGVTFLQNTLKAVSPSPVVDLWQVPCSMTAATGIQTGVLNPSNLGAPIVVGNETTLTQTMLDGYCEVWDVRFLLNNGSCPGASADVVTSGAGSDTTLYTNYLAQNGNLFITMDNAGYCIRDTSVLGFVSSVIGCSIPFSNVITINSAADLTTFNNSAPYNFKTNDNTLTDFQTDYPAGILSSNICGGTPLTTDTTGVTVTEAVWKPSGGGTLEVSMDTNSYCEYAGRTNPGNALYYQNVYTLLANCIVLPTNTPTNTPTLGNTATNTPTQTATNTATTTPTNTATQTATNTSTNTVTQTPTGTATNTPTATPVFSATPTDTPTLTPTNTPVFTATPTFTSTVTPTFTPTVTATPNLYIWPNPYNPKYGSGYLKAGYLGPNGAMSLYTVSGELVISSKGGAPNMVFQNGYMIWNGRAISGLYVSTGVYYYVIQDGSKTLLSGKLLVVTGK